MRATECCGWTGWAEMAGIGVDGRRLAEGGLEDSATRPCIERTDATSLGALYLLMRRLGRRTAAPTRSASAERAVGAP